MRNAIRGALGVTVAVLAVFGGMGAGGAHRGTDSAVSSTPSR
ncbi:hypothetical protein [Streptosporangium sp. NPDC051022]